MDANDENADFPIPLWSMLQFELGTLDHDAEMVAVCNGRRVVIRLLPNNFTTPSIKEKYLFFIKAADNFEDDTVEDFYDWIAKPLLPFFEQLNQLDAVPSTLEAFLFPDTHFYSLRSEGDAVVAVPDPNGKLEGPLYGAKLPESHTASWPSFKPSEIHILEEEHCVGPPSPKPSRVQMSNGQVAFLKLLWPSEKRSFMGELDTYKQIRDANLPENLQISRLHGIVRDDDGILYGLLLTYIDSARMTLSCAASGPDIDAQLLQKWSEEIDDIAGQLHKAGIAWGDAKSDNILMDRVTNSVWLIDFGGSYTEGWVPRELAGTVEGDLVGIGKIKEFLRGELTLDSLSAQNEV